MGASELVIIHIGVWRSGLCPACLCSCREQNIHCHVQINQTKIWIPVSATQSGSWILYVFQKADLISGQYPGAKITGKSLNSLSLKVKLHLCLGVLLLVLFCGGWRRKIRNAGFSLEKMMITYVWVPNLSLTQVSPRVYCLNKQNRSPKNKTVGSEYLLVLIKPHETWLWTHTEGFRLSVCKWLVIDCSIIAPKRLCFDFFGDRPSCVLPKSSAILIVFMHPFKILPQSAVVLNTDRAVWLLSDLNANCSVSCVIVGSSHAHKSRVHMAWHPRNA